MLINSGDVLRMHLHRGFKKWLPAINKKYVLNSYSTNDKNKKNDKFVFFLLISIFYEIILSRFLS